LTTLQEVSDAKILITFVVASALNGIILFQIVSYSKVILLFLTWQIEYEKAQGKKEKVT
jgi:hypothetical protein